MHVDWKYVARLRRETRVTMDYCFIVRKRIHYLFVCVLIEIVEGLPPRGVEWNAQKFESGVGQLGRQETL